MVRVNEGQDGREKQRTEEGWSGGMVTEVGENPGKKGSWGR
jgi:hypothetical protein